MNIKGTAGESSEGNEEHVIGTWKGDLSYTVAGSLAELCPTVMWKAELVSNKLEYLAEEHSKQSVEDADWFLLIAPIKCERKDTNSGKKC